MKSSKVILIFLFSLSVFLVKAQGVVSDAVEYQVLKDIFNGMGGTSWTTKTNWPEVFPETVSSAEFGTWYGVTVVNGDIIGLDFPSNNLVNSIPASIGQLGRLGQLYLSGNHISGSIPSEIGDLSFLIKLTLDYNQLTGNIPSSVGNLTSIQQIWLGNNQLTGSLPLSIGNLTTLRTLHISNNQLSGSLPAIFSNLGQLVWLNLSYNDFSGSLPDLSGLVSLEMLDLVDVGFSGPLPAGIIHAPQLTALRLNNNQFSGTIPSSYGNLLNLTGISFNNNQLTGEIPSSFSALTKLAYFNVGTNQLSGQIPSSWSALTKIYIFDVSNNDLTGSIGFVSSLPLLQQLMLQNNDFAGDFPSVNGLNSLQYVWCENNHFQSLPVDLPTRPQLYSVNFTGNELTQIPDFYSAPNKANLELRLGGNRLTFEKLSSLAQNYPAGFRGLGFSPQAVIDEEKSIQAAAGGDLVLTASVDRNVSPALLYRWYKVVNNEDVPLNTASTTGHTVTIPGVTLEQEGTQYYYSVASSNNQLLTLTSQKQTLDVIQCTTAVADFASEALNGTHSFTPSFTGSTENCSATYHWDFGDGTTSAEQAATHSYTATGTFTVTLTINYTCAPCPGGQITSSHDVIIENSFCGSIYCDGAGNVGIGTHQTNGFRLSVNGKIRANDIIKVYPQNQWSDFVFEKDYKLLPLSEVEKFIKKNGHLPQIPSAKEVETDGIDLGGMDAKLLQKIEELTLYMIALQKENELVKQQNEKLASEIKLLREKIN